MKRLSRLRNAYSRHGLGGLISRGIQNPSRALDVLISPSEHFYTLELPVYWEDIVTIVPPLVNERPSEVVELWREIRENKAFIRAIEEGLSSTDERPAHLHSNWREFLYVLVRLRKPAHVIETGVYDGLSSAYILAGLQRNGSGTLTSIDINDKTRLPADINGADAGWLVPDSFKERWQCRFGDAEELLPEVVAKDPPDIFLHDSLHTSEHMRFELDTAISAMDVGGLVMADNTRFNEVFRTVAERELDQAVFWKNTQYAYTSSDEEVDDRFGMGIVG